MAVFNLYSKRKKKERGDDSDVYIYDKIPQGLRVQIIHIWGDTIGNPQAVRDETGNIRSTYQMIVEILRREYEVFKLSEKTYDPNDNEYAYAELCTFFLAEKNVERVLDIVEVTARVIDRSTRRHDFRWNTNYDSTADEGLEELNQRFKEHGIGYEITDGEIIRIDSKLIHAEVVKPALQILRRVGFENAQKEFLEAHEHFRHGKNAQALVECYKAFESTMKIICTKRKWEFDKAKGAADLVRVILDKNLIPLYWQSHLAGLKNVLESAIPTPRNKQAGHGAGAQPPSEVPNELAAYVLHMTAATILFLAESDARLG